MLSSKSHVQLWTKTRSYLPPNKRKERKTQSWDVKPGDPSVLARLRREEAVPTAAPLPTLPAARSSQATAHLPPQLSPDACARLFPSQEKSRRSLHNQGASEQPPCFLMSPVSTEDLGTLGVQCSSLTSLHLLLIASSSWLCTQKQGLYCSPKK